MSEILLYHYGGSYNHGCEALVRTISAMMKDKIDGLNVSVASERPYQDLESFNESDGVNFFKVPSLGIEGLGEKINCGFARYLHHIPAFSIQFRKAVETAKRSEAIISIGGDVYSYGSGSAMTAMDNGLRKHAKKSILWGCSINKEFLHPQKNKFKINGLSKYDLIIARESITYDSLLELGLKKVVCRPDPAFTLKPSSDSIQLFDNDRDIIGINMSPLIFRYESKDGLVERAWMRLIEHILSNTDLNIALIPHVENIDSSDYKSAEKIYEKLSDKSRVRLVENGGCMKLKKIISCCRMFIGSRTHATIAAYSSCVPTLAVGYSVKSRGIARDIFGSEDKMVISVQNIADENDLIRSFQYLADNESDIRSTLKSVMPDYIEKAESASDLVAELISN